MFKFELQLGLEFARELYKLRASIDANTQAHRALADATRLNAAALRQNARATFALTRVLREIAGNRNASSIEFGPLQILDKP